MFCPDTDSKKCIKHECVAYKARSKPSLCKCRVCNQEFHTGGSCTQKDHRRDVIVIKEYPYCNKYKVNL